ncbi:MAG: acyl carrier protein [Anaerolineales bacterium]
MDEPVEIIQELAYYIKNQILQQPWKSIQAEEPLISSGILDSFHLVDLALYIEDRYGVRIEDTELNRQTFDNLIQLTQLIQSKIANK